MTRKEAFEKIKKLIGFSNFENAKLADGTLIQWEGELKEGTPIMMVDETGNMLPLPDEKSPVQLEDGTKITCVGGLVTAIEKAAAKTDDEMNDFIALLESLGMQFKEHKEAFTKLSEKVTAQDAAFEAIKKTVEDSTKETKEKFAEVLTIVQEIADEPAADSEPPADKQKFAKKPLKGKTPGEKLAAMVKAEEKNS